MNGKIISYLTGNWSPVDFFEIAVDPASVGDVRHPASGLANCHWQFSPELPAIRF